MSTPIKMGDSRMHVINNIFLPRRLPQSACPSNGEFVREFAQVLGEGADVYFPALKEAKRMMQAWSRVQFGASVSWENVHAGINGLLPGQTFALYLHAQNAGITVSIKDVEPSSASATLAVFRVAAGSDKVMQARGDLYDVFPSWAVTTDAERVRNETFAKQVASLASTEFVEMLPTSRKAGINVPEPRDVPNPSYVTEWLLLAVAGESVITGEKGAARVRKKIRDDVLWKAAELPWRRSGEYMTVKFVLQSLLVGTLGEHHGLISYKYILIQAMTRILLKYYKDLETDIVMQMLTKLARRLSKLSTLMDTGPGPSIQEQEIHSRVQEAVQQCSTEVVNIRAFIDERWERIMEREKRHFQVHVDKSKLSFEEHITHSLKNAQEHLQLALDSTMQPIPIKVKDPICSNRNKGCSSSFPNLDFLENSSSSGHDYQENLVNMGQALYDIEGWVQKKFSQREAFVKESSSEMVFKLLRSYLKISKKYYKDDALGSSRMVLTTITLVAILDFMATRKHWLLKTYNHGVNVAVLQSLLLVHRADMEHLATLEAYFATRSKNEETTISLISEDEPSPCSFSVRFFDSYSGYLQRMIRDEILRDAEELQRLKRIEVLSQRRIYDQLLETIRKASHDYKTDRYGYTTSICRYRCTKCRNQREAQGMEVKVYEKPLPDLDYLQKAVVFELATPTELSVLRDALHIL